MNRLVDGLGIDADDAQLKAAGGRLSGPAGYAGLRSALDQPTITRWSRAQT